MRYIDEDKIYQETADGRTIFEYYFPDYEYGSRKAYLKLRAEEKTASAQISYYKGSWRITDFGNQQEVMSLKAIPFVMWRENLNYYEALKFVEEVILHRSVDSSHWRKPQWRPVFSSRDAEPDDVIGRYTFVYKQQGEVTQKDLEAIGRYITPELLEEYNCRVLKHYEYCHFSEKRKKNVVDRFEATEDYPMFVFDYGDFRKLYRPHELDKKFRFLYDGRKPKSYIYGLKQLQNCRNEFASDDDEENDFAPVDKPQATLKDIFRCSGESDALNLASLGYHVYWLNSESADLKYDEYKTIDNMCQNHYQIMDLDATGRQMAQKNALRYIDLLTIELPDWLALKKDFRGNPCKDLKDFINLVGSDKEETRQQFIYRKVKARKVRFWNKDEKGNYYVNMEYFYHFLHANGYYQMDYRHMTKADYCYVWLRSKIVDMIAPENIKRIVKRFTKDWVSNKNLTDEIPILNKLNTSNQITEANIDTLRKVDLKFVNCSAEEEYIHFRNGSLKITPHAIERVRHEDVPNHILGSITIKTEILSHVIDRNISVLKEPPAIEVNATPVYQALLDRLATVQDEQERNEVNSAMAALPDIDKYEVTVHDDSFIFTSFLRDITRLYWRKELEEEEELTEEERKEEMLSLANVMFCLGYLCAQYKHQAKPWIVYLQDTKESEIGKSSGRSGKSLLSQAVRYVRQHFYIDGRQLDKPDNFKFLFDGLTEFHDVIEVDDFAEYGDFQFFYTQATGSRTVNCKHTSPFVLDYEESGKLLISTNFELQNTDSSTMARLLNCGVSDYYHEQTKYNDYLESRSPYSKFGRQLYKEFTDEEWTRFYNFIAYCIQLQMRFHKIQPPLRLLERRQLRREMSSSLGREENFLKWANDYFQLWNPSDGPRPARTPSDAPCVYLDTLFNRRTALEHFLENSGISDNKRKSYNAQRFKSHLRVWAEYQGYELNPESICTDIKSRRIVKKEDGKTIELFYISTTSEPIRPEENPLTREDQYKCPF